MAIRLHLTPFLFHDVELFALGQDLVEAADDVVDHFRSVGCGSVQTGAGEGDDAGKINVGVTATVHNQWVIFDNFKLMYYGPNVTTAISEVKTNGQQANEGIYNLSGQKVQSLKKGLYIINGKKVVKK